MKRLSTWQKVGAGVALSGGLIAAGELLSHEGEADKPAEVLKVVGGLGLAASGVRTLGLFMASEVQRIEAEKSDRRCRLPQFADDASYHRDTLVARYQGIKDIDEYDAFGVQYWLSTLPTMPSTDASWVLNQITEDLVTQRQKTLLAHDKSTMYEIAELVDSCAIMDQVAPISPECAKTPQTSDEGKYWFDYIDLQARHELTALAETS